MENSCKRRASFVDHKRKSLTFNNIFTDIIQEELKIEKAKHSIRCYLESLKKEKQDWKDLLSEKRAKYKECEGQYSDTPMIITKADTEEFITLDNKQFIKEKPNYLEMMESVRKYINAINYLNKYKSDIIDYYDKAYNEFEIHKKILVEEMCAADLCEICNVKNCSRQEHKFIN